MSGQGSPQIAPFFQQPCNSPRLAHALRAVRLLTCWLLLATGGTAAEEGIDIGLRITWGGRQARLWRGSVRVEQGSLSEPRRLGYEVDLPGSWQHDARSIRFEERSPSSFDGFDLFVQASRQGTVTIELEPDGRPELLQQIPISLANLVSPDEVFTKVLKDEQSRLLVRRMPGDQLRLKFSRNSLVFGAGESFTFQLIPHRLQLPLGTPLSCLVQLEDSSHAVRWSDSFEVHASDQGIEEAIPAITIPLPLAEGVYEVVISINEKSILDTFMRTKRLVQRKVQLVVIGDTSPADETADFVELDTVRLGNPSRFDIRRRLQSAVGGVTSVPLVGQLDKWEYRNQQLHRLGPSDFYAAPLPVARIGAPHIVEIEYPSDMPQTLGVSVVEANGEGAVTPIQVDSGIDVRRHAFPGPSRMERHALVFWPRTKTPWMLLTNRRPDAPAAIGNVRVLHGPDRLPAFGVTAPPGQGRMLAAYFDKPLFLENFSAPEATDERTGRSLRDWNTFFEGGRRLVEYLKYVGYNAAVVSVAREGSALYPSKWLEPTPRFDNGTFFFTGQDPIRKDVLEALFRLFDREGLTLIPAVHFGTPLPELEHLLVRGGREAVGVALLDDSGSPWRSADARRGQGPHYNPLNPRVQQAIGRVVDELADRYAHHPSFGGLALQVAPNTYLQLPGQAWALDDDTLARFESEHKTRLPLERSARVAYLLGPARQQWLEWRAERLTSLHRDLQLRLARRQPEAKLYLVTSDMLKSWRIQQTMHPRLLGQTNFPQLMLNHGLVPTDSDTGRIVQLRPRRLAPHANLATQATNIELNRSAEVDDLYRGDGNGALSFHEPQTARVEEFDRLGPFPHEKSLTWLASQIPPSGLYNRARFVHAIATLDVPVLVDGGWTLPLGQEPALREIFEVYRRLPAEPFTTQIPKPGRGIVVRTLSQRDRSYIYLVNNAPWPVQVQVAMHVSRRCSAQALDTRPIAPLKHWQDHATWKVDLRPYDLVGAVLNVPQLRVTDWQAEFDATVEAELAAALRDVQSRIARLDRPAPLDVLENPNFEAPPTAKDPVPGWNFQRRPGVRVEIDQRSAAEGRHSLHFKNDTPQVAWVRSKPFQLPKTGRIAVQAAIRTANPVKQPALRVAFDVPDGGSFSYIIKTLGRDPGGAETERLSADWPAKPYVVYWNELPVGQASQVLIGFDLNGAGEVWIDDVRVLDLHFEQNEREQLVRKLAPIQYELSKQRRYADCYDYLDSYWPRFLLEYVPATPRSRVTRTPRQQTPTAPPNIFERLIPRRVASGKRNDKQ